MKKVFKFLAILIILLVAKLLYNEYKLNQTSHFTITSDTNVSAIPGLSKYVTQEEVDSFSFRYWDIDVNEVRNNPFMENFRQILKSKDTANILLFIKDNNISVDTPLHYGVTPLMYSSFYNDENTTRELIKLGADIHKKDKYGLSPMAYAISMNCVGVVKDLFEHGVRFEEVDFVQGYLLSPGNSSLKDVKFYDDRTELVYEYNWYQKVAKGKAGFSLFDYLLQHNLIEIARMALESGYRPLPYCNYGDIAECANSYYDFYSSEEIDRMIENESTSIKYMGVELFMDYQFYSFSLYRRMEKVPNHEKMLDLFLEYNIAGQPSKGMLEYEMKICIGDFRYAVMFKYDMIYFNILDKNPKEDEIKKLYSTDVAKMNYEEILKEFGKSGRRLDNKQLEDFNFYTRAIRDFGNFCGEDYMSLNFSSIADIFEWRRSKDRKGIFKGTKEFVNYRHMKENRMQIFNFFEYDDKPTDSNESVYVDRNETKPSSNIIIMR
ncbi:ankyrin repeat domain-containing protein [Campylobacter geochelonis]|uniref:Ankyrin repeat-containing protein n=1 Tax=Campylobacter geochelonis TaxID=1780362 RepID=A0A128EL47_9BACT|nr:ankyrin repeat domain-containing protein [Campylobacter geochelonis]QKF71496.1 ankyrin domain-containing protein [Campylobacter geochelonis]CZE49476.1 ankyrin repeat-containing protein [Campylobacter geochelonis]